MREKTNQTVMVGIAVAVLVGLSAGWANAATLFNDSFDYGDVTADLDSVSSWSSGSTYNDYDHDGGLDVAAMNGETGGAVLSDRPGGNNTFGLSGSPSIDMTTLSEGDTVWFAVLFQYVTGTATNHYLTTGGGSVTSLGFQIASGGDVEVWCSDNGGGSNTFHDTGVDAGSGTYLMLLRATKGSGTSPTDSVVDFWFDPADASSVSALGSPDWTTGADSKFGRDGQSISGLTALSSQAGRTDEIRLGTSPDYSRGR
jgi:hypothetical protein